MKNKYIDIEDIDKAISNSCGIIYALEAKIAKEKKRMEYLQALLFYLEHNGICPFTSKELLNNDIKLQVYVMPILARMTKSQKYKDNNADSKWDKLKLKLNNCMDASKGVYKKLFKYTLDKMYEIEKEKD